MKTCITCGEQNKDNATLCTKCGKKFDAVRRYPVLVEIEEDKDDYELDL